MVFDEHKYRYRSGRSFPIAAQVAGEELEKLGVYQRPVPPSDVVKAAKPAAAPLHPCFEWNNSEAANLYRENQARDLMRSIAVVVESREKRPENQIAFVSVGTSGPNGQAGYIATSVAMGDDDMRERVIGDAVAQLRGWQARYRHIEELAEAVKAVNVIVGNLLPQPALV